MGNFSNNSKAYNITTNPNLPFDWNEKYSTVSDFDIIRENTFNIAVGKTYLHDTVNDPNSDEEDYLMETVKKYTDTSQFMVLHTAKAGNSHGLMGLYRTDAHYHFTMEEKQIVDYLSPVLVSISQMTNFYSVFDFKRAETDELRKVTNAMTIILNEYLLPIDIPRKTELFLRRHFQYGIKTVIPEPINNWIKNTIAPEGRLRPNTGPWLLKLPLAVMDLYCKAFVVVTEFKQPALLINLIPHGEPLDFAILSSLGLSKREIEALSYLPLGYTNRQIAMTMNIEEVTVKKHFKNASKILGTYGKTELLYQAIKKKELLESLI